MIRFNIIEKLKMVFNIKKFSKNDYGNKKVGIINKGKNGTFINCEGVGPDAGLIDISKNSSYTNSKFTATGRK